MDLVEALGYGACILPPTFEAFDEIIWQKGNVGRDRGHGRDVGGVFLGPANGSQQTGERSMTSPVRIGDDVDTEDIEAPGLAVGVENELAKLRPHAFDDVG